VIELDHATHTYRVAGRVIPSVTQCLSVVANFDHVDPVVLEDARLFGTHVHMATDLWDRGILDEDALDPRLAAYLGGWKKFLHETGFKVTHTEQKVYNASLAYAGTLDKRGDWKKTTWLLDLKSGAVPAYVGYQTAAYREALPAGERPRRRLVVQLKRNNYKVFKQDDAADFSMFVSCLNIYRRHGMKEVNNVRTSKIRRRKAA
jgi:hypothetical protein